MLATGSLVTSATAFRVGASCLEVLARRTPPLLRLAAGACLGPETGKAEAAFRDDLIGLARDAAEASYREVRRGIEELDAFTRPDGESPARPRRPYRVKL